MPSMGFFIQHSRYLSQMNMDLSWEWQCSLQRPGYLRPQLVPPPLAAEERTRVEVRGTAQGSGLSGSLWCFILRPCA